MKKLLLVLLCLAPHAQAGDFSASAKGTTSANFLKLGVGGRALGMGEAYSAVADEASALYWNPAALTQVQDGSLAFMHAAYIGSSFYDYAAAARNLGSWGSVGLSGQFLSMGNIAQTDAAGNDIGSFNPHDMAFSLGYAHNVGEASVGLSAKLIRSTILNTAQAEAVDVGFFSPGLFDDRARLAFTATNIGSQLKYESVGEDLPRALRVGSRWRFTKSLLSSLDMVFPQDNGPYAALGTEYVMGFTQTVKGAVRAGYNTRTVSDVGALGGLSLGTGIAFERLSVDYAFVSMGPLGMTHRFSVTLRWGGPEQERPRFAMKKLPLSMVSTLAEQDHYARRKVLFQYRDLKARAVVITGDFNYWSAELMRRREDGTWVLVKELPEGTYHYRIQVEGGSAAGKDSGKVTEFLVKAD